MRNPILASGGIIGCSTAFYLAQRGVPSVIIERHGIASCASGKAGGFLAKNWCSDCSWDAFARASFDLHMELAERFKDCDYRRIDALRLVVGAREASSAGEAEKDSPKKVAAGAGCDTRPGNLKLLSSPSDDELNDLSLVPAWVDGPVSLASKSGDPCDSAQVHPRKLCWALLEAAKELVDVQVVEGRVTGFVRTDRRITGVNVTADNDQHLTLSGSAVVIAMGPWSGQACQWLGLPPLVGGCRGHSVIAKVPKECLPKMTPTALFAELVGADDQEICMEIYPRPDETIYMCGLMDYQRMPASGSSVLPCKRSIQLLREKSLQISSFLTDCEVLSEQACFMPRTEDDLFVIGQLPGAPGAFIGSGHNYWGILGGPATGRALAELIVDGHCGSFDIAPFNPRRFFSVTSPREPSS